MITAGRTTYRARSARIQTDHLTVGTEHVIVPTKVAFGEPYVPVYEGLLRLYVFISLTVPLLADVEHIMQLELSVYCSNDGFLYVVRSW